MTEQNMGYPAISEKAWWAIRNKFKASIPSVVTPTYVKTLLSMANDNSANSNIIVPMKRLGIIDDENKPTALANDWRIDEKYSAACDTMLKKVYPTELLDLFPDKDIDKPSGRTWFMSQGVGQAAADKMVALFTLLKSGEIKDSKTTKKQQSNPAQSKKSTSKNSNKVQLESSNSPSHIENNTARYNVVGASQPNLHIDLQIHISPDSTPEQIECIFASMAKHLYGRDDK